MVLFTVKIMQLSSGERALKIELIHYCLHYSGLLSIKSVNMPFPTFMRLLFIEYIVDFLTL